MKRRDYLEIRIDGLMITWGRTPYIGEVGVDPIR